MMFSSLKQVHVSAVDITEIFHQCRLDSIPVMKLQIRPELESNSLDSCQPPMKRQDRKKERMVHT